jgi:hypothetical protein
MQPREKTNAAGLPIVQTARSFWTPLRFGLALLAVALFVWFWWLDKGIWLAASKIPDPDKEKLGQVGDLFGGLSAMFAALAFAGVAFAAYYQHLSLQLLVDESKRVELRHARTSFEPLFFQLISRYHVPEYLLFQPFGSLDMPNAIPFPDAIQQVRRHLQKMNLFEKAVTKLAVGEELTPLLEPYLKLYRMNEGVLGPFWRSLYHVFKLIERSDLDEHSKVDYANIARATLNKDVVFFLALNCATEYGKEFKPFVERFGLLKHVARYRDDPPTVDERIAEWFFSPTATMSHAERVAYLKELRAQTG